MPPGQFSGQPVPVPAGPGIKVNEAGLFLSAAGERDGHPPLGEDKLFTWTSQVEGDT